MCLKLTQEVHLVVTENKEHSLGQVIISNVLNLSFNKK